MKYRTADSEWALFSQHCWLEDLGGKLTRVYMKDVKNSGKMDKRALLTKSQNVIRTSNQTSYFRSESPGKWNLMIHHKNGLQGMN